MRRLNKLISLALGVLLVLGAASCGKKEEKQPSATENTTTVSKIENDYRIELCNFEQWKPDFSLIRLMKNFGKVSLNEDMKFVKSGKYSAKVQPMGGYYNYLKPVMYYPFSSSTYEFNYEDFTYVDYIEFWIYNAQETQQPVNVGLVSNIVDRSEIETYPSQVFYLQPKQWNLVTYYVDFASMAITQKIQANALMQVKGVYFEFESAGTTKVDECPVYYMDDLNLYYKEDMNATEVDLSKIIEFNHKEGTDVYELCDFEHVYQKYIFTPTLKDVQAAPTFAIVEAKSEGIEGFSATSGKHVLRIETQGTEAGTSTTQYKISGEIVRAFYDKFIFDYDTQTDIIPVSEWGNYYFAYDVYAGAGFGDTGAGTFGQTFRDGDEGGLYASFTNVSLKKGEWVTQRISLADIANWEKSRKATTAALEKSYNAYKEHYVLNGGRGRRVSDAGSINFTWSNFKATEEVKSRVIYFDNIRVYKA